MDSLRLVKLRLALTLIAVAVLPIAAVQDRVARDVGVIELGLQCDLGAWRDTP